MYPVNVLTIDTSLLPEFLHQAAIPLHKQPGTRALKELTNSFSEQFILLYTGTTPVRISPASVERFIQIAKATNADMLYSDYYKIKDNTKYHHPTIEYQTGSLRDDFDFGQLVIYKADALKTAISIMDINYEYAALYDLRLKISRIGQIVRIPEPLYTITDSDSRKSGEKQFDYVNPKNREVQIEMERACTDHLKAIGAWLPPIEKKINFDDEKFLIEASVIIPVKNRAGTITDAINSILEQKTNFPYNILVVDNFSTDGTTEILCELARENGKIIHLIPQNEDLGIGGCWNEAIMSPHCGKFAVQLDSDDLYNSTDTLQKIVDGFHQQGCAMLIGSYQMVNFKLEEIPPGLIDHREWTPENGHNNALRINGLGAPRAFYTPILRQIKFPDVSYGEDYAVGLAISRQYTIGRIYEPLYLCRRWEENSDSDLNVNKLNTYNFYKDKIRTFELQCRILRNKI